MRRLDERQEVEREVLVEVSAAAGTKPRAELRDVSRNSEEYERQEKLDALAEKRPHLRANPGECVDSRPNLRVSTICLKILDYIPANRLNRYVRMTNSSL